ncbi:MAG: PQ-loop domain-containing transporter [Coxiellaceae bacterium]|nr:PQ-loop domain-containing transporter [Coxiellaceae bacterium]
MLLFIINTLFGIGLFVNALLFLPQALRLLKQKNSADISLITFFGFCITQLLAILYGYLHQDWILMIGYILSLTTCAFVTGLAVFYRLRSVNCVGAP